MGHGKDISERGGQMEDAKFLKKVVGCCSGISYTYKDYIEQYPDLTPLPGPTIGDRAPDVDLETGHSLFSIIGNTKYTLLLSGTDLEIAGKGEDLAKSYAESLQCYKLGVSAAFQATYEIDQTAIMYLIRPDGYIGFRCLFSEIAALEEFLSSTLVQNIEG